MTLKIKADEDLPGSVAVRLRGAGYLAETVVEEGLGGTNDPALWRAVQAEMVLREGGLERLQGTVAAATPRGLRIRKS